MADEFVIKRAERKQARLRLAFQGSSNSGKTTTALLVALGVVDGLVEAGVIPHSLDARIGVIDTERQSASLYSHLGAFDVIELGPPYTTERYAKALHALENAGYPVIIIDSLSHEWMGAGGILSMADKFGDWKDATPVHDEFVDAMLRSPAHLMVTMRSKTAWVLEKKQNRSGQMVDTPRRVGLAPVQRPGIEYEFTTLLMLDNYGKEVTVVKDRTEIFAKGETIAALKRSDGGKLVKWLLSGAPLKAEEAIGATPKDKAKAIAEAAVRNIAKSPTLPDLARLFDSVNKELVALKDQVAIEELAACRQMVVDAKDARKADFGTASPVPDDAINPDAVAALEEMLAEGRLTMAPFLAEFDIPRLGHLPAKRWVEATGWIIRTAAAEGYEVRAVPYPVGPVEVPEPTLQEKARHVVDTVGAKLAGGSMFEDPVRSLADMEDDVPL